MQKIKGFKEIAKNTWLIEYNNGKTKTVKSLNELHKELINDIKITIYLKG